jgi:hypothetical protein
VGSSATAALICIVLKPTMEAKCPTETGAPAACALGSFGGPLVLYCLASKTRPNRLRTPPNERLPISSAIRPARAEFFARGAVARRR